MRKQTLIFIDLSASVGQTVAPDKTLLDTWKDGIRQTMRRNKGHGTYTIVGLGSGGWGGERRGSKLIPGRILGENMSPSQVRKLLETQGFTGAWSTMGGTVPLTKEIVEHYSKKMGGHTDLIYYTDAYEGDGYGLGAETFEAHHGRRTRIGNRYVTRDSRGRFDTNVDVGRSISADKRIKAKTHADRGYRHQGDDLRAEEFSAEWSAEENAFLNAEDFEAESRFDKLANKVARQYEKKGYDWEEAQEIGKKVAYKAGVKKYGKKGMARLTRQGIEKARKRRERKASKKARTMARKGARRGKAMAYGAEGTHSNSRSTESWSADTMSWENSAPYATLKGYNPVDSVQEYPPLGYGVTQNFGSEHEQGYNDRDDESFAMRHRGRHSQSLKDRRDESKGETDHLDPHHPYADVETMDLRTEYDSPYGPRQTTDFGVVGMGNDFAQNAAEDFSAEGGSQFMSGARYGAGAVLGITGATLVLGSIMSLFMR